MAGRLIFLTRSLLSSAGSANWHSLGRVAAGASAQQERHWNALKALDAAASGAVEAARREPEPLDWAAWEARIAHRPILAHMRATHASAVGALDRALSDFSAPACLSDGWESFDSVAATCAEATRAADRIISDGIRALWISQHNPPAWRVDSNEWLESDQYWQAFVEKHSLYSQSGTSADPESPSEVEAVKNKWHANMFKFNERTDTPVLYDYMEHNPAWEFYDVNRRQFLEQLEHFLLRTGEDFRHLPDLPRWQWLTQLEDLRFRQFSVEMRRKHRRQLQGARRFEASDLGPGEHESAEEAHLQLLLAERAAAESVLARLLGSFGFLADPLVPVADAFQLSCVLSRDGHALHGATRVYSLGDDLPYLYVLPHSYGLGGFSSTASANVAATDATDDTAVDSARTRAKRSKGNDDTPTSSATNTANTPTTTYNTNTPYNTTDSPLHCFYSLLDHLNLSGFKLNPSYATRLQLKCQVMHERGPNWLKMPGEMSCDAFLRRLRYDEPLRPMLEEYVEELKERMSRARLVPESEWAAELERIGQLNSEMMRGLSGSSNSSSSSSASASGSSYGTGSGTGSGLSGSAGGQPVEATELRELVEKSNLLVRDADGNRVDPRELLR